MDFLVFPSLRFQNVARGMTAARFAKELTGLFENAGHDVCVHRNQVTVYSNQEKRKWTAIVRDVPMKFGTIKSALAQQRIADKDVVFSHDYGMDRSPTGEISNPMGGAAKKMMDKLFMMPPCNHHELFPDELAQEIRNGNFCNKLTIKNFQHVHVDLFLHNVGRVLSINNDEAGYRLFVEYFTLLEKLQALSYLNNNPDFAIFCRFRNCNLKINVGLGYGNSLLNVEYLLSNYGYIPFSEMNQELVKIPSLEGKYNRCFKCEQGFISVLGVTPCLKFLVGECSSCYYGLDEDPLLLGSAVRFQYEQFSRILIGRNEFREFGDHHELALHLVHTPLKLVYENPTEAMNIICSIAQQDAWVVARKFALGNFAEGKMVLRPKLIEVINLEDRLEQQVGWFEVQFRLPVTATWRPETVRKLRHLAIPVRNVNFTQRSYELRALIGECQYDGEGHFTILCHMVLRVRGPILRQQSYTIYPYKVNNERDLLHKVMTAWETSPNDQSYYFLNKLLLGGVGRNFRVLGFQQPLILSSLTKEQAEAAATCQRNRLALVQGASGTGKTRVAAVTALELARTEQGMIVCVAISNEDVIRLCEALSSVLEVQLHSPEEDDPFRYSGIKVTLMTSMKQQRLLRVPAHLSSIHLGEVDLLSECRILVTPLSSLYNQGVVRCLNSKALVINTVILDESGVISVPKVIPVMALGAKRLLLFGDMERKSPYVNSFSAETAGLKMSILQYLQFTLGRSHPLIWKTLMEKYDAASSTPTV